MEFMTGAFSAGIAPAAPARMGSAAALKGALSAEPSAKTSDDDFLLELVGRNVAHTNLGSLFAREFLEGEEIAGSVQLMTRNLRTSACPIVWAAGNYFVDSRGKMFLDFCAQTQNLNFGHNHPYLVSEAVQFLRSTRPYYTSSKFGNLPTLRLVHRLSELLPAELSRINPKMLNGADAVETALKAALKYHAQRAQPRTKIVSLRWAHHGHSIMTMACSNKYTHLPYIPCDNNRFVEPNDLEQLRTHLRAAAGVAAFIVEPLQMNGGAVGLTDEYVQEARRLCTAEDIVLVFDEIQTGFGWTGRLFAFEHYGVVPDALCLSKSLASGFPLSAVALREQYDTLDFGEAEFTGGMNPLSATVALANLELLTGTDVMRAAERMGTRLKAGLQGLAAKHAGFAREVRGLGLMLGLETTAHEVAKRIYDYSLERGVLLRISKDAKGETILVKPSLIVTARQIDKVLEVLDDAFASLC